MISEAVRAVRDARCSTGRRLTGCALVAAMLSLACSSYVGTPGTLDGAVDRPLPVEVGNDVPTPAVDAAPTFAWCGVVFSTCNPTSDLGCPDGQRCAIEQLMPPRARCEVASDRPEGARCGVGFGGCGPGLHCLAERCLRPCCFDRATDACGDRSSCAVFTEGRFIRGCTQRGTCDYLTPQSCPAGSGCFPISPFGEGTCLPHGAVRAGGLCVAPNDCIAGYTCLAKAGAGSYCVRVCNPENNVDPSCSCVNFFNRPADFGGCR